MTTSVPNITKDKNITVSVIVPSVSGLPVIAECLEFLDRQNCDFDYEIIVVDRIGGETSHYIYENFPNVILIKVSETCSIPEMRARAMDISKGKFIAVTEDHCIVPETWLVQIVRAHRLGYKVIAGCVENGSSKRLIDWAVFLCEYSSFMPPIHGGEVDFLTGNNTSYDRQALAQIKSSTKQNCWEYFYQQELKQKAIKFLAVPQLEVVHKKSFGFFYFLSQRFYYSRSFAAMRKNKSTIFNRFLYLCYVPILPLHQLYLIARNVRKKNRNQREFILSLPILLLFMSSYALGELIGLIFGSGSSLSKVE